MVLPNEITQVLNNLEKPTIRTPIEKTTKRILNGWKKHVLYFPTRFWKYSIRNITGDLDALLAGNPKALRFVPRAISELFNAFYGDISNISPELKEFQARGGAITIESVQELKNYKQFREFNKLIKELDTRGKPAWKNLTHSTWNLIDRFIWSPIQKLSDFREQTLRYAAYLEYLHQMQNNENGLPNNWGASNKDEVMSLDDIRDRAFKMANELLGAYDQVSETGQHIRNSLIPFYSWMEVNAKRLLMFLKNGITEDVAGDFASKYLKGHFANAPYFAYKVSKTLLFISLFSLLVKAFNNLFWPEDEEKLPPEIRDKPHVTLGHDENGNVRYFSGVGMLYDNLEWFGLDSFKNDVKQILNGQMTVTDWIGNMLKAPFKKIVNGLNPFYKTPFELGSGMSFYPDFTHPHRAKNALAALANSLGFSWPYKAIDYHFFNGKDYSNWDEFKKLFIYSQNSELAAYFYTKDLVDQFRERVLHETFHNDSSSPKSMVLRRMRDALRFNDRETALEALTEYYNMGGTKRDADTSIRNSHPLQGLNKANKERFLAWISDEERKFVQRAEAYYERLKKNYDAVAASYVPPEGTQQETPKKKSKKKSSSGSRRNNQRIKSPKSATPFKL